MLDFLPYYKYLIYLPPPFRLEYKVIGLFHHGLFIGVPLYIVLIHLSPKNNQLPLQVFSNCTWNLLLNIRL